LTYRLSILSNVDVRTTPTTRVLYVVHALCMLLVLAGPLALVFLGFNLHQSDRYLSFTDLSTYVDGGHARGLGHPQPGTSVNVAGHPQYGIRHASTALWLLDRAPGLIGVAAASVSGWLLARVIADVDRGRPFTATTTARLRRVAATIAAAAVVVPLARVLVDRQIVAAVVPSQVPGLLTTWDPMSTTVPWLFAAGLLVVLTEVFRIGLRLSDDVEGLV
jgi:hypothetical protein